MVNNFTEVSEHKNTSRGVARDETFLGNDCIYNSCIVFNAGQQPLLK